MIRFQVFSLSFLLARLCKQNLHPVKCPKIGEGKIRKQSLWRSVHLKTRPWKPRRRFSSAKPTKPLWLGDGDSEQGGRERTSTNVTSRTLQANGNNRRRASWCTDDTRGTLSGTCWPLFPPASPPGPPRPVRMRSGPPPVPRSSKKGKSYEHLLLTLQSKFNYPISKVVFSSLAYNFIQIHLQQLNYRTLIYFFSFTKGLDLLCCLAWGHCLVVFKGSFTGVTYTHSWTVTATVMPPMRKMNLGKAESVIYKSGCSLHHIWVLGTAISQTLQDCLILYTLDSNSAHNVIVILIINIQSLTTSFNLNIAFHNLYL